MLDVSNKEVAVKPEKYKRHDATSLTSQGDMAWLKKALLQKITLHTCALVDES